ncbi:hypothetical protein [Chitinophaga flava]|uniref:Uncharacterized protein n=1 Tax=Chitinophaga flava TaxID=2259036 RepID=A0A365XZJ2_9BACT|nr:hypothetical protein [Chitinophaga flava]RBL91670.1 hypothetical protein DF182_03385 [Chitinophaga flava]
MMYTIKRLLLLIGLLAVFLPLLAQEHSMLKVTIAGKEHTFYRDIVARQLIAQTFIDPNATLGFFTDRSEIIPFYFSCVITDIASGKITLGDYPVMQLVNDMPVADSSTRKAGFLAIKINDKEQANPLEYTSIPGSKNIVTINEITAKEIKGLFNTQMQCVSDATKQLNVSGSFVIKR